MKPIPHFAFTAQKAFEFLLPCFSWEQEEFWVLALGPQLQILNKMMIFRGTVDSCLFHPRDVFRFAVGANASSLLAAHNHPCQSLLPSTQDELVTRQLVFAGRILGIPLHDHLIVTKNHYLSFRTVNPGLFGAGEVGEMRFPPSLSYNETTQKKTERKPRRAR